VFRAAPQHKGLGATSGGPAFYRYERESIHGRGKQLRGLAARAFRDVKEHHDAALAIVRDWNWGKS
jgi:hypothetical protein